MGGEGRNDDNARQKENDDNEHDDDDDEEEDEDEDDPARPLSESDRPASSFNAFYRRETRRLLRLTRARGTMRWDELRPEVRQDEWKKAARATDERAVRGAVGNVWHMTFGGETSRNIAVTSSTVRRRS